MNGITDLQDKKYIRPDADDLLQDFHTDLSVGDIIHRARIRSNLELSQISSELRIRESYLEAIEKGHLEKLPGRIYAIGFIRTYAEHLGLDGEKIVQLLKRQSGEKVELKPLPSTLPVDEDHSVPTFKTLGVVFLLLIGGLISFSIYGSSGHEQRDIPSVPSDLKEQVTLLSKPQAGKHIEKKTDKKEATALEIKQVEEAPPKSEQIVLKALDHVWLEIRSKDGKTVFSRVLKGGEEYWVPEDQKDLVLTLGNAGGLQIMIGDQKLPILGPKGKVIRALPLEENYLKDILKKFSGKSM